MNNSIKYYLAAYNAVAFIFWLAYLLVFIGNGLEMNATGLLLLNIAQGKVACGLDRCAGFFAHTGTGAD